MPRPTANRPSTGSASRAARRPRAMDVLGELIVRPTLDHAEIEGERTVIIEEIRCYQDDPVRVRPDPVPDGDVRRRPARTRDLRRRGRHPGPPRGDDPRFLADDLPAGEHGRRGGRRHRATTRRSTSRRRPSGPGNGAIPGFEPAPVLPAGERSALGKRADGPGPARRRRCRHSTATTRTAGRWRCSTPCSATG